MPSTHSSLDAAATERKGRLAKLQSLKRKQPPTDDISPPPTLEPPANTTSPPASPSPEPTSLYLSNRNYDPTTRGPKLGFENLPSDSVSTIETRAAVLAAETREHEEKEAKEEKPIDLFTLQPRKPNWDLKRDLARKMEVLGPRTENALARLVSERVEEAKEREREKRTKGRINGGGAEGDGEEEAVGIGGVDLVEGVHVREREEEEEERREREEDPELA